MNYWCKLIFITFIFGANQLLFAQKDSSNLLNMSLEELMNLNVFSASKKDQHIMEAPAIMSVVSRQEIEQMGAYSLIDVLKYLPGIETSIGPDGIYRVAVRGNRKEGNILMLINGQQVNDSYNGKAIFDLPVTYIEKIEVIRGPGSSLFGTNAVAAVINIFLSEASNITAGAGPNNTYFGNLNYNIKKDDFKFHLSGGYQQSDGSNQDIETDAGDRTGNTWDLTYDSLTHKTSRSNQDGYLNLNLNIGNFKCYSNTFLRNQDEWVGPIFIVSPGSKLKSIQQMMGFSYEYQANEFIKIVPKIYSSFIQRDNLYQETPYNYVSNVSNMLFQDGKQSRESYTTKTYGAELDLYIKLNDRLNILTGNIFEDISMAKYDMSRNYKIVGDLPQSSFGNYDQINFQQQGKRRFIFAYFLQVDYKYNRLNLTLGLRYDDYNDFGQSFNPRIGLNYKISKSLHFKALYGKAFRAPTFQELYDNSTIGNQYGVSGNAALKPEIMQTTEIGFEYQHKRFVLKYNGFYNINSNLIRIYDPYGGGSIGLFQNIGSTRSLGHEFEAIFDVFLGFRLQANFSQFMTVFEWNDKSVNPADVTFFGKQAPYFHQLLNIPRIRGNLSMSYSVKKLSLFAGFNAAGSSSNNHRYYLEKGSFAKIPAYIQGNITVTYALSEKFQLKLSAVNLGKKYSDPDESTNIDIFGNKGLIQPGAMYLLSLRFKLK